MVQRKDFQMTGKYWWIWIVVFWLVFVAAMLLAL